jgi:NAD(P)H-dependent FMN reductase
MAHKNTEKMKILVIVGTVREGRVGRIIADWYLKEARKVAPDLHFELLDVKEENLALFNEPVPPIMHKYSDVQQKLAKKIESADGFVFVTAEYNHSIPGSLKNFLDYVSLEWNHKATAYVGYGGSGAIRSIEHLIQILSGLGIMSVKDIITITNILSAIDEKGSLNPEFIHGDITKQLKELRWWASALKNARQQLL